MRSILRTTIVLLLAASALPAFGVVVSGTVRNAAGSTRLAGMIVEAYDETGRVAATATSDSTGFYGLSVPTGRYRFLAYDSSGQYATEFAGHSESYETSPVFDVAGPRTIDFFLTSGAFISGNVTSGQRTPRPGMTVAAYNMSGTRRGFTKTDATGLFFLVVPPGPYRVVAYDEAGVWSKIFYAGETSFAHARTVTLSNPGQTAHIGIATSRAARITGKVVDSAASIPLGSMVVYAYTTDGALVTTAATDNLGNFRLLIPPGTYRLVVADPSRAYATEYLGGTTSFAESQPITLTSSEERGGVNFAMSRGGSVEGRVLGPDGTSLEGIVISVLDLDGVLQSSVATDADGRYALAVRTGEVIIVASDPLLRYASQFHLRAATFRDATRLGVAVGQTHSAVDFNLPRGGRLHGRVASVAGASVAGVTVAAYDAAGMFVASDVTGPDGVYNFVVLPGNYRLAAFDTSLRYAVSFTGGAASYETSQPVSVSAGGVAESDFTVRPGVRVTGTVVSRAGEPLNGMEIIALDGAGNNVGGAVSSSGAFAIMLVPGDYRFLARDVEAHYRTVYYRNGARLEDATVVSVTNGQVPPPLQFVLDTVSRRRSVRH